MILGIAYGRTTKAAFGRYHAVETHAPTTTADACTAWDHLPLHHPVPADTHAFTTARCGAELPHDRFDVRWVEGTHVTCPRCGTRPA